MLSAIAASLTPCLASNALFAVTTDLPDTSACSTVPLAGSPAPADQLDEHVDTGLARERGRIGKPFHLLEFNSAILCARARTHRDDLDGAATTRGQRLTLTCNLGNKGGADCAQTGDTHFQRLRP